MVVRSKCAEVSPLYSQQAKYHGRMFRHFQSGLPVNYHLIPIRLIHSTLLVN